MQNTATDIIPPYGFIHVGASRFIVQPELNPRLMQKPSTLWPPPPPELTETVQQTLRSKVKDAVNKFTSHAKQTNAEKKENLHVGVAKDDIATATSSIPPTEEETTVRGDTKIEPIKDGNYESVLHPTTDKGAAHHPGPTELGENHSYADPADLKHVIQLDIAGKPVTIRSQIQLYATNDQLSCRSIPWSHRVVRG
jgi:hypothetical protein